MSAITNTEASPDAFEQLAANYIEKFRQGERLSIEQFAEQYPEHATQLKELLPTLLLLEEIAPTDPLNASPVTVQGTLGDFRILRQVGRGGMGIVYEAEQISLNRKVALKVLPFAALVDQRTLQRFKNEVAAVASLDHPNIVEVFAVACDRGVHHYAMRLIRGSSVAQILDQMCGQNDDSRWELGRSSLCGSSPKQSLVPTEKAKAAITKGSTANYFDAIVRFGASIAQALDYAHENGVIHRDVKPANLMVDEAGKAWVTDFGLAQMEAGTQLTMTGDVLGTAHYMSPEQLSGKRSVIDYRTDIYSLGVTLYEMLTLSPPFQSENRQDLYRCITQDEPTPPRKHNPSIPVDLETIILKALEKSPADRYASAFDLAEDLSRFLQRKPVLARRPGAVERARKFAVRNSAVIVAIGVVASMSAIILSIICLFLWRAENKASQLVLTEQVSRRRADDMANKLHGRLADLNHAVGGIISRTFAGNQSRGPSQNIEQIRAEIASFAINYHERQLADVETSPEVRRLNGMANVHLAHIFSVTGDDHRAEESLQNAIREFSKLIKDFPRDDDFYRELAEACRIYGGLLHKRGCFQRAGDQFQLSSVYFMRACELNRTEENLHVLARLLARCPDARFRNPSHAAEICRELIARGRDERLHNISSCKCSLGIAYLRMGNYDNAIAVFEESLNKGHGASAWEQLGLAICHWNRGDRAEANRWYAEARNTFSTCSPEDEIHFFWAEAADLLELPPGSNLRSEYGVATPLEIGGR